MFLPAKSEFQTTSMPGAQGGDPHGAVGDELAKVFIQSLSNIVCSRYGRDHATWRCVSAQLTQVLSEFYGLLETEQYRCEAARSMRAGLLTEAFGPKRAADLLLEVERGGTRTQGDLAMLQKMDPQQLSKFLADEHPQTVALVLAHLGPKRRVDCADATGRSAESRDRASAGRDAAIFAGDGA